MDRKLYDIVKDRNCFTIDKDGTVTEATKIMIQNRIDGVLITDNDNIVGIFTDSDLKKVVLEGLNPNKTKVSLVGKMGHLICVSADKTLCYAIHLMHDYQIRHLPILIGDRMIGLVCSRDIISADFEEFEPELKHKKYLEKIL